MRFARVARRNFERFSLEIDVPSAKSSTPQGAATRRPLGTLRVRSLRSSSAARCNNCSPDRYVNATEIVTNQPNFCLADFQPKYRANRDLKLRLEVMQSKNNSTPPMHMRRHLPHDQSCLPLAAALCTGEPLGAGVHLHVTCTIGVGSQFGSQLVKVLERLELTQTQTLGCIKSSLAPHELPTPNSQAGSVTQQSGRDDRPVVQSEDAGARGSLRLPPSGTVTEGRRRIMRRWQHR